MNGFDMKKLLFFLLLIVVPLGSQSRVLTKQDWIRFYTRSCKTVSYNQVCREKLEKAISLMNNYLPMFTFQLKERKLPTYFAILCIIESNCKTREISYVRPKKCKKEEMEGDKCKKVPFALGLWQPSWRNIRQAFRDQYLTDLTKKQIIRYTPWRDAEFNTNIALWILDGYYRKYKDVKTTLYAYNAGSTKINAWLRGEAELPKETENFYLQFQALNEIVKNQKAYGIKADTSTKYLRYVFKNKLQEAAKWFN